MKQQQKTTVTLSMLWIAAMIFASRPGWIRNVVGFVSGATGHPARPVSSGGSGASLTP